MAPARFPDGLERRAAVELRADTAGRKLIGYAALFGSPTSIGSFSESIRQGAFTESLAGGADILALVDHDPTRLLARRSSGTLRLTEDALGLHFEIDAPDTQLGRDMVALAERRDLGGASFGFRVKDDHWPRDNVRELRKVELIEISLVQAFPAYAQTSVQARSRYIGPAARMRKRYMETLPCHPY
jgi:HK97 family phage prohead protease